MATEIIKKIKDRICPNVEYKKVKCKNAMYFFFKYLGISEKNDKTKPECSPTLS